MKLSVIIPCFNEVDTIEKIISAVRCAPCEDMQIIVVDDFSTDGTRQKLETEISPHGLIDVLLLHDKNQGKGAAIRTGLAAVEGEIVIIQDADLEYDPQEYPKLLEPIIKDMADVVYGSRFSGGQAHRVLYFWHRLGNAMLTLLSNMLTNLNLSDMETCYKAFRYSVISSFTIEENRFGIEPELTAKIAKTGCRVYEVGISYHGRTYREGKKIGWKDGFRALWCIFKYNLLR